MQRDKLNAIKDLANRRIEDILDSLGVEYEERYNYLVGPCPVHGGDRRDAFSFLIERGIWQCFSRGCDKSYGADIIGLVRGIRQCTFKQATNFLSGFVNLSLGPEEIQKLKDERENREFIAAQQKKKQEKIVFPNSCLDKLSYHCYLESRGYPRWLVEKYQIGACLEPGKYMSNRIVVPVLNPNCEIIGFTGRTLDENWSSKGIPKWKHSRGGWVSYNLFNIHAAAKYIEKTGIAILCEGPLDVLRLEEAGIHNGVAILGKKFYEGQMAMLAGVGATSILDALDNDAAGKVGSQGIKKTATCLFNVRRVEIPDGLKDIGEMEAKETRRLFNEYAIWN
jgi:DNA primase